MKISDLDAKYDKLQLKYGAKELKSIYNGGCEENPDICFVFMNPTGKNVASDPEWKGRRSPWIGTKNVWKLFYKIGLLDEEIYEEIEDPYELHDILKNISLDDIGAAVGVTKHHILRTFKRVTGYTLTEHVNKIRCEYAKQLLEGGDHNVKQAAMLSGFENLSHFTNTFKKHIGCLPSEKLAQKSKK